MFHTCKTFLLAVTVDVVAASFASRSDLKIDQGHSAAQVMNSVGAMLEKRGMDAGVLGQVLAKETPIPDSENALHEILSSVIVEIETTVITKIEAGHRSTQEAINSHIEALSGATQAVVNSKTDASTGADKRDQVWFACVKHEKFLRSKLMSQESHSITAQSDEDTTCQIKEQADIKDFSSVIVGDEIAFECAFGSDEDDDCNMAYQNYHSQVNELFASLEYDVEDARSEFVGAYDNCELAKTKTAQAKTKVDTAEAAWQAQTEKCSSDQESRTLSVCNFGSLLQIKCERLNDYNILMTSIDQEKGGEYSFPDRVAEFSTAKVTICMLSKLIAGEVIDEAAFESCHTSSASAYVTEIGNLDRHETSLGGLVDDDHFSCKEHSIKFYGKSWTVETTQPIDPSTFSTFNYIEKENVLEQVSIEVGTDPFSFCAVEPVGKR